MTASPDKSALHGCRPVQTRTRLSTIYTLADGPLGVRDMLQVFVFGPIAITVGYWEQRGAEVESGARVEVRRVEPLDVPGAAPGVAGLRILPVTHGIWRADLFRDGAGVPIFHYHPHFEAGDVGARQFDDLLTRDPVAFVIDRLSSLPRLLAESGAGDVVERVDLGEVERSLPLVRVAIERSFQPSLTAVG